MTISQHAAPFIALGICLLALGLGTPAQAAPLPCSLATELSIDTYTELSFQTPSQLGLEPHLDDISLAYARCQASALSARLARSPRIRERVATLRELYQTLRAQEGQLAYIQQGGGTLYWHAVPRSYPEIEMTLRGLAALASSRSGAQTGAGYAGVIRDSKQAFEKRLTALRTWPTGKPEANAEYDPAQYAAAVKSYAQTGQRLMSILGTRSDAATAAGYLPLQTALFLDDEQ